MSAPSGPLAPLAHRSFAILWIATVASNTGTWMNDVGSAWLMTTMAPSPVMVALVQTATTLPVFLFALPAGALADILDRRKMLLAVNAVMACVAALLTFMVTADAMTPALLLVFTFLLGAGAAFVAPAWQAIVPGLVPRSELAAAISLNSVGINVSRAIGPALAGALIVALGLYAPFLLNTLSFVGILLALWFWRPTADSASTLPPERLIPAAVAGLRYARRSEPLRRTILRATAFFIFASAYWAMLPLVARDVLNGGSTLYGLLMGAVGAGAVLGAFALPKIRKRVEINRVVMAGGVGTAVAMAVLAAASSQIAAIAAALLAGASWIAVLSSLQVAAQTALPNWVRARGLSLFLTAFFGAMSLGALLWGLVAEQIGVPYTLLVAAIGLALAAIASMRIRLEKGDGAEHAPTMHWAAPPSIPMEEHDQGPVLVTVDYQVAPEHLDQFKSLIKELRRSRLRDGAYDWHLYKVLEQDSILREAFTLHSWLEHLRQHERVTEAERKLQQAIRETLVGGEKPVVVHHVSDSGV